MAVARDSGGPVYKGLGKGRRTGRCSPLAGLVYLFLYAPIAVLIFFSFNSTRSTQVWTGFSTRWYGQLLTDQTILHAFRTSLTVGVIATLIATVIGTLTALALSRHGFRGQTVADSAIYAATVMPEIVVGVSLLVFFVAAGFAARGDDHRHRARGVHYLLRDHRRAGQARRGWTAPWRRRPRTSGPAPVQTFLRVTLPLILPGVMAGALLAFTLSFDDFVITFFVSGVGSSTLPLKIYSMIRFGVSPVINALSTVVLVATMFLIFGGSRILVRQEEG